MFMPLVAVVDPSGEGRLIRIQGLPAEFSAGDLGPFLADIGFQPRCVFVEGTNTAYIAEHCPVYVWAETAPQLRPV
jgi:hypothetical protein